MRRAIVRGTGHYLPERVVENSWFEDKLDTSDEWIRARTGIERRHFAAEGQRTSDLGILAARAALDKAGLAARDIDAVIVATSTPDLTFPSVATMVQAGLGMTRGFAYDLQAVCAGFVFALANADAMIRAGLAERVLVIGAETFSRIMDWTDRGTCVLFGDGAGAVVLKADADTGILSTHMHADGSKAELLWNPVGVSAGFKPEEENAGVRVMMAGNEVFKHAVKALDAVVEEALESNGLDRTALDWLVPHQANLRIIEATAKRLAMPMDRVIVTVDRHGNTSSGSVPLALDEAVRSGRVQRGQLLLLEAFGGGFTWGSALLRY